MVVAFYFKWILLSTARLFDVAIPILALSTNPLTMPSAQGPNSCAPHQRTTFLSYQASNQISLGAKLARCAQEPEHLLYERLLTPLRGQLQ